MGKLRGKWVEITSANTDKTVFSIPKNKLADVRKVEVRNSTASAARIRLWDKWGTAAGQREQKLDLDVAAGDSVVIDTEAKKITTELVVQSSVATVQLYVGVELT